MTSYKQGLWVDESKAKANTKAKAIQKTRLYKRQEQRQRQKVGVAMKPLHRELL